MVFKKNWLIWILFFLVGSLLFSQNNYKDYHKNIISGRITSDLDSTVYYYKKAFKKGTPFPKDLMKLSYVYSSLGKLKDADKYFLEAIAHGYQLKVDESFKDLPYKINYDSGFLKKHENSESKFGVFIKNMANRNSKKTKKRRKKFLYNVDPKQEETYETLLQNEYYFQEMRLKLLPSKGLEDSEMKTLNKYLNTGNSYLILDLLKKNEFPNRMSCSRFNEQTLTLLFNHAIAGFVTKEDAKECIDLLWDQVVEGNITPYDYAKAYDHYTGWYVDSDFTYFGTTIYSHEEFDNYVYMNVQYPESLNQLRAEHWLMTIEQISSSTGFYLPLNYTKE